MVDSVFYYMSQKYIEMDLSWIVPHSPVLSQTLQTHINEESCSRVISIKYRYKCINKGRDQATLFSKMNMMRYQSGRYQYISTSEAIWSILSFPIHERFSPVFHLDVHLENGQRVYLLWKGSRILETQCLWSLLWSRWQHACLSSSGPGFITGQDKFPG